MVNIYVYEPQDSGEWPGELDFRSFAVPRWWGWSARDSGACVEDEGLVYALFRRAGHGAEGAGEFGFAVLAGAGLVDPDGPLVGGSLIAQAEDGRGLAVSGQ